MDISPFISLFGWSVFLVCFLASSGIFVTMRLALVQIRHLAFGVLIVLGFADKEDDRPSETGGDRLQGDITYFQSLFLALSLTVTMGSISGIAAAILIGGPGALFWIWITTILVMAVRFAEGVLAAKHSEQTDTESLGGPMYYIEKALRLKWLAGLFAVLMLVVALSQA